MLGSRCFSECLSSSGSTAVGRIARGVLLTLPVPLPPRRRRRHVITGVRRLFTRLSGVRTSLWASCLTVTDRVLTITGYCECDCRMAALSAVFYYSLTIHHEWVHIISVLSYPVESTEETVSLGQSEGFLTGQ